MTAQVQTTADVELVLSHVTTAAGGARPWDWHVIPCDLPDAPGWLVRVSFWRPDRDTPSIVGKGYGRWWHVPRPATESSVVKTAWLAVNQIDAHERMEAFRYCDARIFDPHNTVAQLASLQSPQNGKVRP